MPQPSQQSASRERTLAPRHPRDLASCRDEVVRAGVERMLSQALEVEAELHISRHRDDRDPGGKRLVVRNGYLPTREIRCGAGTIQVHQPRVHDARVDEHGRRYRFSSTILPAYARQAGCIERPQDAAYLRGLATGDLTEPFAQTFGSIVAELPRSFVPRLEELWEADRERMSRRVFEGEEFAEVWADEVPRPGDEGSEFGVLILGASAADGVDVLETRLARLRSESAWADLATALRGRGLDLSPERLHATSVAPALAAVRP